MDKAKRDLGYDKDGARRVMRKRDYLADMSGMFGLGLMGNLVGQLQYFYTDKIELAVAAVGIVMLISKVVDALTDIWVGNLIDHSKGGNRKYYAWMFRMAVPAGVIVVMMFTVPVQAGQIPALIYVLVTNLLLTAVILTLIGTPFSAAMVVRTRSQAERNSMGLLRAVGIYSSGVFIAIATIPVTNLLGGTQSAWIKYGAAVGLVAFLTFLICCANGRKAEFAGDAGEQEPEEDPVPFREAAALLFKNKYWIIVLLFNVITNITNTIAGTAGAYYTKWIFGNDNLVGIVGAAGLVATVLGFILSKPIISKLGVKKTILTGFIGAATAAAIRCFVPANFTVYLAASLLGSFIQIPLMCLYGVLLAMTVDYNEYRYDKKLVAVSSGAIGFGNKVGGGLGSVILSAFLFMGNYDAALERASTSMRYAIYGFSNYLPLIINLVMFFVFTRFDLEEKLPAIHKEIAARRAAR